MGVPGLWDVLRPTGQARALAHLAVEDGFVANEHGHRAYRIGIDASIWFFHALGGREGENPELRTLFFRCARLLAMPYLPIFVFDGPGRPKIKRGKAVGGKEHWLVNSLRTVLEAFGFECRTAPGEAEAELAFLNRVGAIDAVLSDDVDCFIFGAHTVMRNGSVTLSGNRAHATSDAHHVYVYRSQDIATHPDVRLSQGGLILMALLRGGDYDENGVSGCGISTAHALARAGFGDTLLAATRAGPAALAAFLPTWRAELREELRTNASGFAKRKCPAVAKHITDAFPALDVLRCYTDPLTSQRAVGDLDSYGLGSLWKHQADVGKIAHVCERFFEWGFEEVVVKRFRTVIWPGAILRALLRAALERDACARSTSPTRYSVPDTPSKTLARSFSGMALIESREYDEDDISNTNEHGDDTGLPAAALIKTIHATRRHQSTDNMLEYRVEVRPRALVAQTRAGMQGLRIVNKDSAEDPGVEEEEGDKDEDRSGKHAPDPDSTLRIWMPAAVVEYACPRLVAAFEGRQMKKAEKKSAKETGKGRGKAKRTTALDEEGDGSLAKTKARDSTKAKVKMKRPKSPQQHSGRSDHFIFKTTTLTYKTTKARHLTENVSDADAPNTHSTPASVRTEVSSDDDPIIVPAGLSPTHGKARLERLPFTAHACRELRLFPSSPDDITDPFVAAVRGRTHSASVPSSDTDAVRKSPRTSAKHTSPRKLRKQKPQVCAPSPSPVRPPRCARMMPPKMARTSKSPEDVIVISSGSDTSPVPLKAPLKTLKAAPNISYHDRVSSLSILNMKDDEDFIDLT